MSKTEHKSFASPDEVRTFEKGKLELVNIGGAMVGRFTLQPGWMWSARQTAGQDRAVHEPPLPVRDLGHMHGKMAADRAVPAGGRARGARRRTRDGGAHSAWSAAGRDPDTCRAGRTTRRIAFQHASSSGFDTRLEVVAVDWAGATRWREQVGETASRADGRRRPGVQHVGWQHAALPADAQPARRRSGRQRRPGATFGDVSYVQPDVHASGKVAATGSARSRRLEVPGRRVAGGEHARRDPGDAADRSGATPSVSPTGGGRVPLRQRRPTATSGWRAPTARDAAAHLRARPRGRDRGAGVVAFGALDRPHPARAPDGRESGWSASTAAGGTRPRAAGIRRGLPTGSGCTTRAAREGPRCLERVPADGGTPRSWPTRVAPARRCRPTARRCFTCTGAVRDLRPVGRLRAPAGVGRRGGAAGPGARGRLAGRGVAPAPPGVPVARRRVAGDAAGRRHDDESVGAPRRRRSDAALTDFGDRSAVISRSVSWSADSRHLYAAVADTETDIVLFDGLLP